MMNFLPEKLKNIARALNFPLFVVGGAVRNHIAFGTKSLDIDLSSCVSTEEFVLALGTVGLIPRAVYPRTGTVMFEIDGFKIEYTSFRTEKYRGGEHTPYSVEFTSDIEKDALRRDFKCNAVYYDILTGKFNDPLGGLSDIKKGVLDTVKSPDLVFCSDGLRLMRLARFCGELGFKPTIQVLDSATKFSKNILDVSPERVFSELKMILLADQKYPFSPKNGHYLALEILDRTRVLDQIMIELTEGRNMVQRADYHKFDVLKHSLKTVQFSPPKIRLAALLHDVGKPYCFKKTGRYFAHAEQGAIIAKNILNRLKADNATISRVIRLITAHMLDMELNMRESKLRRFIVKNADIFDDLLLLKQADFKAGLESEEISPTVLKWQKLMQKMRADKTPFSYSDLSIKPEQLIEKGCKGEQIGRKMRELFDFAVMNPQKNNFSDLSRFLDCTNNRDDK